MAGLRQLDIVFAHERYAIVSRDVFASGARIRENSVPAVHHRDDRTETHAVTRDEKNFGGPCAKPRHPFNPHALVADFSAEELERELGYRRSFQLLLHSDGNIGFDY